MAERNVYHLNKCSKICNVSIGKSSLFLFLDPTLFVVDVLYNPFHPCFLLQGYIVSLVKKNLDEKEIISVGKDATRPSFRWDEGNTGNKLQRHDLYNIRDMVSLFQVLKKR